MNKSAYAILPSAIKVEGEDEEELDPLIRHGLKVVQARMERKGRWFNHVEKEDERTNEKSLEAINRASSCRDAID
jgi:hypothetical protein